MPRKLATGPDRLNFTLALIAFLNEANEKNHVVTAGQIASHFDVELKDLNRALKSLQWAEVKDSSGFEEYPYEVDFELDEDDLEIPLEADAVIGFRVSADAKVNSVPQFSAEQATALVAGLQYLRSLPDSSATADIDELIKLLTSQGNGQAINNIEYRPGTISSAIEVIQKAIQSKKRIRCSYQNQKGEKSVREMDPLRIDPRASSWQLRAWCHSNNEPRNFRIDSMSNVELLETDWLPESSKVELDEDAEYRAKETDVEVLIEADPEGVAIIADFGGKVKKIDKKTGVATAVLQIGFLPYFGRAVARFGGAVRVISPAQAREVVRDYALKALGQAGDSKDAE